MIKDEEIIKLKEKLDKKLEIELEITNLEYQINRIKEKNIDAKMTFEDGDKINVPYGFLENLLNYKKKELEYFSEYFRIRRVIEN